MKLHSNTVRGCLVGAALALTAGCSQMPGKEVADCSLRDTNNVDRLFEQVSQKLEHRSCHYSFDEYQRRLLAATKGAPEAENEARFASLLRISIDRGIISRRQGQEIFSRYFDPEFYAVKADARSSCSSLRDKDSLYASMRSELAYKREGMLEILDDEDRFRQAQHYYNDLRLVFDAVDAACTQDI